VLTGPVTSPRWCGLGPGNCLNGNCPKSSTRVIRVSQRIRRCVALFSWPNKFEK
jgi:hypothetical protein